MRTIRYVCLVVVALFLFNCGGGGGGTTYVVGGSVGGLSSGESVTLQNNAGDDLTVSANGAIAFATAIANGAAYSVTVLANPTGKTCTVNNGAGTISGANITDVSVVCLAPRWARTVTAGDSYSNFYGVSSDADGNIYAVGYIGGTEDFTFGEGVTVHGTYADNNVVIVKYNATGTAQWARSVTAGGSDSNFYGVSSDTDGNIYAVGYIAGTGDFTFGEGVTVHGTYASGGNVVIVKYNATGTAQWARTVTAGDSYSNFNGVSSDADGNIYAVGYISGTGDYTFGEGVTVRGGYSSNILMVKYNATGTAQWARTITAGGSDSNFYGVSSDVDGNVYAVGYIYGIEDFTFGEGVTVRGTCYSRNLVIVKYNATGTAQWARTVTAGVSDSNFYGVSSDADGNVYAVGYIGGAGDYTLGEGVTVRGVYGGSNVVIVKYNATGTAQWARSVTTGSFISIFYGVSSDADGNIYAVGYIGTTVDYTFGEGVTVHGTGDSNVVIVKYGATGTAQWARSITLGDAESSFNGVSSDTYGNIYAVGYISGTGAYTFSEDMTVGGPYYGLNAVIVHYLSE